MNQDLGLKQTGPLVKKCLHQIYLYTAHHIFQINATQHQMKGSHNMCIFPQSEKNIWSGTTRMDNPI